MKKTFKTIALTGLLAGCLAIGGISAVALANGNAYDSYKQAALQTLEAENMTMQADYELTLDGEALVSGNSIMQFAGQTSYSYSNMQFGAESREMEHATAAGVMIQRIGDEYTSIDLQDEDEDWDERYQEASPSSVKLANMVADLLIGDVKTHFSGNGNTIELNLEGAQVPELLNLALAAASETAASHPERIQDEHDLALANYYAEFAQLRNLQVDYIRLQAAVEDGYLTENLLRIGFSGTDADGLAHKVELVAKISLSEIGSTIPQTIATEGKTITEITAQDLKARYYRD